jgi:hypothetical protein
MKKTPTVEAQDAALAEQEKIKAQAEIDAKIKATHKAIHKIVNVDEHGVEHALYLREPSRWAVGVSLAQFDTDVVSACETIFNDAAIKEVSDIEYFQQNAVFYGLIRPLQTLVVVKKSISTRL